jgi:oligopeptide transport system substrate-binding protein
VVDGGLAGPAAGGPAAPAPAAPQAQEPAPAWGPAAAAPGWDRDYLPPSDAWKKYKQELIFDNGADIETLDPAIVTGVPEHRIFMAVYEGLVLHDPKTTEARPGTAETWTISPDGRTYTFTIRADAKWSNGAAVTADDFRYSWWRVLAPKPPSQYAYMLYDIANATAFAEGRIAETALPLHDDAECTRPNGQSLAAGEVVEVTERFPANGASGGAEASEAAEAVRVKIGDRSGWVRKQALRGEWKLDGPGFAQVGIKVLGPRTLQVTLAEPKQYFLDILAHQTAMPVHRLTVEKHGDAAFRLENFVGNGTHTLAEYVVRKHIVMVKSATYWNRALVKLEKLTALPIEMQEASFTKYEAGEHDWMMSVPVSKIDEIKVHPDYYVAPYLGTYFYRINCNARPHPEDAKRPHPLSDRRVRLALNLAIDKTTICEKVTKGGQIPAAGYVPPGIPGYPTFEGLPFDRARARELLAEAGYPGGKGFPRIDILYNTVESHKKIAEAIGGMWEQNLGIVVGLTNTEWKVYLDQVDRMDYEISRAGWIGDYVDPNTFMDMFVTGGGNNNTGWSNAEYDGLIADARRSSDPAKRMAMFRRAEEILCREELPVIPIYYYVNQGLLRPKVKGVHGNILDLHPWQYIWIEGDE